MTITEIKYPIDLQNYGPPRTPGLHLSHIINAMGRHTGVFPEGDSLDDIITGIDMSDVGMNGHLMRCVMGYAWENWLSENVLKNARFHPGEFILDGIIMTPDCLEEDEKWVTLHEIKWTFKSSLRPFDQNLMWLYQGVCYLNGVRTALGAKVEECRLIYHPCYVKGNYRGIDPQYRPVEVKVSEREVDGVWKVISEHRRLVE